MDRMKLNIGDCHLTVIKSGTVHCPDCIGDFIAGMPVTAGLTVDEDGIFWCGCGKVFVRQGGKEKVVYDFN